MRVGQDIHTFASIMLGAAIHSGYFYASQIIFTFCVNVELILNYLDPVQN